MAKACGAIEMTRGEKMIGGQGDETYVDYWFAADFKKYLSATTLETFGKNTSGCSMTCLMRSGVDTQDNALSEIPKLRNVVYLIQAESTNRYKIGKSGDLQKRMLALKTGCPYPVKLIHGIRCHFTSVNEVEASLHLRYHSMRVHGEWFELDQNAVDYIKSLEAL